MRDAVEACHRAVCNGSDTLFSHAMEKGATIGTHWFFRMFVSVTSPRYLVRLMPTALRQMRRGSVKLDVEVRENDATLRVTGHPFADHPLYRLATPAILGGLVRICTPSGQVTLVDYGPTTQVVEVRWGDARFVVDEGLRVFDRLAFLSGPSPSSPRVDDGRADGVLPLLGLGRAGRRRLSQLRRRFADGLVAPGDVSNRTTSDVVAVPDHARSLAAVRGRARHRRVRVDVVRHRRGARLLRPGRRRTARARSRRCARRPVSFWRATAPASADNGQVCCFNIGTTNGSQCESTCAGAVLCSPQVQGDCPSPKQCLTRDAAPRVPLLPVSDA